MAQSPLRTVYLHIVIVTFNWVEFQSLFSFSIMSTPWLDSNNVNEMIINKSSKTEFHTHTFHLKWSRRFVYRKPINFPRKMTVNEINTL